MTTTKKKWADRVRAWQSSGLSSEEFSQGQGFTAGGLRHWAYRLRKDAASRASAAAARARETPVVRLARVVRGTPAAAPAVTPPPGAEPSAERAPEGSGVMLEVGRVRISVGLAFDQRALASVLDVLGVAGGQR